MVPVVKDVKNSHRKKRRKEIAAVFQALQTTRILGPSGIMEIPAHPPPEMICQCVINAFGRMLPIDVKLNMFGFMHSVVLVGVMYKYQNLCWVMLNRVNYKIYVVSHFIADASHLFAKHRAAMSFVHAKKWHRQGVNEILCLSRNMEERTNKVFTKLNCLPRSVLHFTQTKQCYDEMLEFLRGVGASHGFLCKFARTQPAPPGFALLTQKLCEMTKGWRVFKKDQNCVDCACAGIGIVYGSALEQTIANLMVAVPSSLEGKQACRAVLDHFTPFVNFVKANPCVLFFPCQDVEPS